MYKLSANWIDNQSLTKSCFYRLLTSYSGLKGQTYTNISQPIAYKLQFSTSWSYWDEASRNSE